MIAATVVAFALAVQQPAPAHTPPPDHWFGIDKVKHFFVAAFTQSVTYSALQAAHVRHDEALATAWGVTAVVSVAKEVRDRRTTGLFSVRDLVWDAAGAGAATALMVHSRRRVEASENPDGPPAASLLISGSAWSYIPKSRSAAPSPTDRRVTLNQPP